jgi:thymidylate synthase (FAD)
MDKFFKVKVIAQTPNPQQVIYAAMHQDYSDEFVAENRDNWPAEEKCGEIIVKRLLAGGRGHYGCYSADTEVLTIEGWKAWPLVTTEDELLAVNLDTHQASFEKPSALQIYDVVEGDKLYQAQSEVLDLLVTQDHRMVISEFDTATSRTKWQVINGTSSLLDTTTNIRFPLNCILAKNQRFHPNSGRFNLSDAMGYAGLLFYENIDTEKVQSFPTWVIQNFWDEEKQEKVLPPWFMRLPVQCILSFFSSMDIDRRKDSYWIIDQSHLEKKWSQATIDIFQATAHINGWMMQVEGEENQIITLNTIEARAKPSSTELVDYTGKVYCATVSTGALMVRRNGKVAISGNCIEHPQITFNCGYFPHSVIQQGRTHRVGISWDVQSARYTSSHILQAATGDKDIEEVFYLRPVGSYTDRQGKNYSYSERQRKQDLIWCSEAAERYAERIEQGMSEEHARGLIPFDYRQHFVVSFNARSFLHFMDLRSKKDAQLEIQQLCELMWPHFKEWMPAVATWYEENRLGKARLAP